MFSFSFENVQDFLLKLSHLEPDLKDSKPNPIPSSPTSTLYLIRCSAFDQIVLL